MHKTIWIIRLFACLLLSALVIGVVAAQDTCPADLSALVEACSASPLGSACTASGDAVPLDQLPEDSAPQIIRLSGSGGDLSLTLVGVQLTAYEQGEMASAGVEVGNAAGYNVNLRGGPGSNFDVVGIMRFDERLIADGQSADGAWLRVQVEEGVVAWVSKSLVSNLPELAGLPVVDANSPAGGAVGHVLTLAPVESDCGESGAYITASGESAQRLTINDVPVSVTAGTLFVGLGEDTETSYFAFSGSSAVGTGDAQLSLAAGQSSASSIDALPSLPPFEQITALGIEPEACLVAVGASPVTALTEPDGDFNFTLAEDVTYTADGLTTVEDAAWLHLAIRGDAWVSAAEVSTLGACEALPDPLAVEAPPVFGAGLSPEQIIYNYLNARIAADARQMQALSCASWDQQAALQSQSFRAMRAELLNVACSTVSQSGGNAVVHCDGVIQTEYNGELRQWELGNYALTQESGAWRMCGEAG
ncbi:MAG: SH3 domain-containing protein [Anaerolinea sp.]|nr:SH3 domain-containing protein [Anaerolinea sp.]